MDVNKNSYTFMFATIMVVVVAAILSFAAIKLKPFQDANVRLEKMQNILYTIGVRSEEDPTKPISREEAEELYKQYISEEIAVNEAGEVLDGVDAFNIDMAKEYKKNADERKYPLYIADKDGERYYILPLRGTGLWGPVWGYISLEDDINTVYGASFDHKTETPGLGAEISTAEFAKQFEGKKIKDDGSFVSIAVVKGNASGPHQVDGISGGTITSVGVSDMLQDYIGAYMPYLNSLDNQQAANTTAQEEEVMTISDSAAVTSSLDTNNVQ